MKRAVTHTLACLFVLFHSGASALEVSAGSSDLQNATSGFDARLNASNAALTTAINQILTCNNRGMIYASDPTVAGRDADGCVPMQIDPTEYEIGSTSVTKPLNNCAAAIAMSCTYDLGTIIGDDAATVTGGITVYFEIISAGGSPFPGNSGPKTSFSIPTLTTDATDTNVAGHYDSGWKYNIRTVYNGSTKRFTIERYNCSSGGCYWSIGVRNLRITYNKLGLKAAD